MFSRPLLLVAGAGFAAAQSISSQCISALLSVASSSDAACLNPTALIPLALDPNSSIISTVDNWLTGLCATGQCSNATLQTVTTDVVNGCSTELQSIGLNTSDTQSLVSMVESVYPTALQVVCLKDTSVNTLCVTELLTDIQDATTTLSVNNAISLIQQVASGEDVGIPQNVTCSNCSKAAYTLVAEELPSIAASEQSIIQGVCGTSFTDGQMPSNIQETAA